MSVVIDGTKGVTASGGLYAQTTFTGTYADGIVVDYTTGMGRISVGASDGLTIYNGGVASTALVTVDSSGNVGIGTSSISSIGAGYTTVAISNSTGSGISYQIGSTLGGQAYVNSGGMTYTSEGATYHRWYTNGSERARIDSSGSLLVGTTTGPGSGAAGLLLRNAGGVQGNIVAGKTASGTVDLIANYYNSTYVGGITYSNTATALVASSDERLKENIVEADSAIEKVKAIQVVSYDWKHDDAHVEFGLVAQQLNTVYPEAVNVGDDGEEIEKTWGVEYGRLTPMLIKAIQEQQAIIQQLQADVAQLKGQA